jgi:LAO/AO transport system kinase
MVASPAELSAVDEALRVGVLSRDLRSLAKAITLVESTRPDHQARARGLLDALVPHSGHALRIGVSGAAGAGKSTFIEALGLHLLESGHRIAVLAVDPSSSVGGGSILGDKTRLRRLSTHPHVFVRPSPASGTAGGVAARTREALLVCEAAGFDIVIVETVGAGQSEAAVAGMTDVLILLHLPHAGDELQAMKKGVIELADVVVVNKADLDRAAADAAVEQISSALAMLRPRASRPVPAAVAVSSVTGWGIADLWTKITEHREAMGARGELAEKRRQQALLWMWQVVDEGLRARFRAHPSVQSRIGAILEAVGQGRISAYAAAARLIELSEQR